MTSREARRLRREAERKAAKLAYQAERASQTEVATSEPDLPNPVSAQSRPAQLDAAALLSAKTLRNRSNAQFSTGPTTPEGKLASSRNSLKHGLSTGLLILPGEDPKDFEVFLHQFLAEHQPVGPTEEFLVKEIAGSAWLMQRAIRLQNGAFTRDGVHERRLALSLRYYATYERAFHRALKALLQLQKERRQQAPGFVSQSAPKSSAPSGFVSQKDPDPVTNSGFVSQTERSEAPAEPDLLVQAA